MRKRRSLLVTGGAGFIGTNFVRYWARAHAEDRIAVLDSLTYAGNTAGLQALIDQDRVVLIQGDIGDAQLVRQIMTDGKIDTVVHFAAESHVDRSITAPDRFIETNILGTYNLLKTAAAYWEKDSGAREDVRFHHVSTDEVYGALGPEDPPFSERSAYAPSSPYAASKASSDHLVRAFYRTYGLPTVITNCSNNYGPFQFPEKLIPFMLVNILLGKSLPIYGDGTNVRDWLYVEDHCRGIELALTRGRVGETYNIGGSTELSNLELVRLLCAAVDGVFSSNAELRSRFSDSPAASGRESAELISFVEDRPGHDWRYAIDATKICRDLGYKSTETIQEGLRKTIAWYLANEDWWRSLMNREYASWLNENYGKRETRN